MSKPRASGSGLTCRCGKPAVWSGLCQMVDRRGFCDVQKPRIRIEPEPRTAPAPSRGKGRRRDGADEVAERLFDMVRDGRPDQEVTDAIAAELRKAAQGPRKWGPLR